MIRVRVESPRRPTESVDKVTAALRNLFPDLDLDIHEDRVIGTTGSVDHLRELIRNQRIRDAARHVFRAGRLGDRTVVSLSKQAAFVGVVNFAAGSALGDIVVEIESDELDRWIDFVAESTLPPRS